MILILRLVYPETEGQSVNSTPQGYLGKALV